MRTTTLLWLPVATLGLLAAGTLGIAARMQMHPPEAGVLPPALANPLWIEAQKLLVSTPPSAADDISRSPEPTEEQRQARAWAFAQCVEKTLAPWRDSMEKEKEVVLDTRRVHAQILWMMGALCATLALTFLGLTLRRIKREASFAEAIEAALDNPGNRSAPCPEGAELLGPCHVVLTRLLRSLQGLRIQIQMQATSRRGDTTPKSASAQATPPPRVPPTATPTPIPTTVPQPIGLAPLPTPPEGDRDEAYFFLELASHKERLATS